MALCVMFSLAASAQSYSALWQKVKESEAKDLPKTTLQILEEISLKAEKEKNYSQDLLSRMKQVEAVSLVEPDSVLPRLLLMEGKADKISLKDGVAAAIYYCALSHIYSENPSLGDSAAQKAKLFKERALKDVPLLAKTQVQDYPSLITRGQDGQIFNNDLLSVIGRNLGAFDVLNAYYAKAGNRPAALLTALEMDCKPSERPARLDSLIALYQDLDVCSEAALRRYATFDQSDGSRQERLQYIDTALSRWPGYKGIEKWRNLRRSLLQRRMEITLDTCLLNTQQTAIARLSGIANISGVKLRVSRLDADGSKRLSVSSDEELKKVLPLRKWGTFLEVEKIFPKHEQWQVFEDSVQLPALPCGTYLLEAIGKEKDVSQARALLYVTDLALMFEAQADNACRYVVVNSQTGQPVPNATLRLRLQKDKFVSLSTDGNGEAVFRGSAERVQCVRAYKNDDRAMPENSSWGNFSFYDRQDAKYVNVFTDRAIYRPGQVVHTALMMYERSSGNRTSALTKETVTLQLRDANHKTISEQTLVTDDFGTANTSFTLPKATLTGRFSLVARAQNLSNTLAFRVEEYKRPTFSVRIDEPATAYKQGDTLRLKGHAEAFNGTKVAFATVKCRIKCSRRWFWRWQNGAQGDCDVLSYEAKTDADGQFPVVIPLTLPKQLTDKLDTEDQSVAGRLYRFTFSSDVTDLQQESQTASLTLSLGDREAYLASSLPDKQERDSLKMLTVNAVNAAGKPVDGTAKCWFDDEKNAFSAVLNKPLTLTKPILDALKSGRHTLFAVFGKDSLRQSFTIFSLQDTAARDGEEQWFYVSGGVFQKNKPVYVQIGSCLSNVHVVYSVHSGRSVVKSGSFELNGNIKTWALEYKKEWGTGLLLNFAWMKNGKMRSFHAALQEPKEDKSLRVSWKTFRNRLLPGQREQWVMRVTNPDGTAAKAQVMALMYDLKLDKLTERSLSFPLNLVSPLPYTCWQGVYSRSFSNFMSQRISQRSVSSLVFDDFKSGFFPELFFLRAGFAYPLRRGGRLLGAGNTLYAKAESKVAATSPMALGNAGYDGFAEDRSTAADMSTKQSQLFDQPEPDDRSPVLRQDMTETAFFYPTLLCDGKGEAAIQFTLPESLTTWRFLALAHDREMNNAWLEDKVVAQKDVMAEANLPRFLRQGDKATLSVKVSNLVASGRSGVVELQIRDALTNKTLFSGQQSVNIPSNGSLVKDFVFSLQDNLSISKDNTELLIVRSSVRGDGFEDGEERYLPVLPAVQRVTVSQPFLLKGNDKRSMDLGSLFTENAQEKRLKVEYTACPLWFAIEALPRLSQESGENAISIASRLFANMAGGAIVANNKQMESVFRSWENEPADETNSLTSNLEKNQDVKDILLQETPWLLDAEKESDQRRMIGAYFNPSFTANNIALCIQKLRALQNSDGSWSWFPGMQGSPLITQKVAEMLQKASLLGAENSEVSGVLRSAMGYLARSLEKLVNDMKRDDRANLAQRLASSPALDYIYVLRLGSYALNGSQQRALDEAVGLLEKAKREQTIGQKARMAVVLKLSGQEAKARKYAQSLVEYTVKTEEMGRFFSTLRAPYSWADYRMPTQTQAMEALRLICPEQKDALEEMKLWILRQKQTTLWQTPINSLLAIDALLQGNDRALEKSGTFHASLNNNPLPLTKPKAGTLYQQAIVQEPKDGVLLLEQQGETTGWGAAFATYNEKSTDIKETSNGFALDWKMSNLSGSKTLKVGDRVQVEITVEAKRDFDFVAVDLLRSACLEPVVQLSRYNGSCYVAERDSRTQFFFDHFAKGKHVVKAEFFVSMAGEFTSGTLKVQSAYAPEYMAQKRGIDIKVAK